MRNESGKGVPMVGVDYGYLWSRAPEDAGDVMEAEDYDGDPFDGFKDELASLAWAKLT